MAGLRLFTSNRLEILADKLAARLGVPLSSPLAPEVIIVQSRGMERWLSMEIARRRGICANVRFPFPKAFVEETFASLLGSAPPAEAFAPEIMTWKLMRLLPSFLDHPGFEQIRRYLQGKKPHVPVPDSGNNAGYDSGVAEGGVPGAGDGLKRFQLAARIARLFDQYLIFRPDMIAAWEKGERGRDDEIWQCELWRALVAGEASSHPAALREAFQREIKFSRREGEGAFALPERISIFGISALPRFHLEIFQTLAQIMEVNLFLMNPSREFWGYISSDRERERTVGRIREAGGDYGVSEEGLYLERGNRLLASCGTLGREFYSLIWDFPGEEEDLFEEPGEDDLLHAVQSDILNLRDRGAEDRIIIAPDDRSIGFHSCHSPMREIEALYDNLLSLFEEDGELLPREILVMAPDIEVYAPLIKAVFDRPKVASRSDYLPRIPFTIADRGSRAESSAIEGFMKVLDMADGRFGAGQVLSLLEIPEIGAKFALTPADSELIRRWVRETGIRWGIDGENRRRLGLPALGENTWQEGLNRLLMGYAMPGKGSRLAEGILPYDLEGSDTAVLGRFLNFTEVLFYQVVSVANLRTPGEWSRFLDDMLDGLFAPPEEGDAGMEQLRGVILRLQELEELSGFREPLEISVIKSWLAGVITERGFGYGFLAGGVTFCSMLPMRSIPFKVICLLGMNGADYPRKTWTPVFDLMAKHPQPADRSRRKDDRYLFLEALLSARKNLIISYVGQDSKDNSTLPPSVLATELLDYLKEGFALPGGGVVEEQLVAVHRLQAFSPAYFRGKDDLFSYSEENWRAARRLMEKKAPPPLVAPLLPAPDEAWRDVDIADLIAFFADPVRFLFQRRLEVTIGGTSQPAEEREPFVLEALEKYKLEQALVEAGLSGRDLEGYGETARASGRLPHGAVGVFSYRGLQGEAQGFVEKVTPFVAGKEAASIKIDLPIAGFRLRGDIPLYGGRLVHFRYAALKIKDHMRLWISHLAVNMPAGRGAPLPAVLLGRDEAWSYAVLPQGEETLAALLDKYWEGLSRPLKLFPLSSWEYGNKVFRRGKSKEEGRQAAARLWRGSEFMDGEGESPYFRLCFGDQEPLDEEFEETAEAVLKPLFHYSTEMTNGEI